MRAKTRPSGLFKWPLVAMILPRITPRETSAMIACRHNQEEETIGKEVLQPDTFTELTAKP